MEPNENRPTLNFNVDLSDHELTIEELLGEKNVFYWFKEIMKELKIYREEHEGDLPF